MNTNEEKTWEIHTERLKELDKKINKLNRRSKKTGNGGVSYEIISKNNVEYKDEEGETCSYEVSVVKLTGEVPVISGYEFIAKLEHCGEAGNIIAKSPAAYDVVLPEKYKTIDSLCDHCKTLRRRNDTFVLRKDEKFYQIGRNCLADYLRTEDVGDALGVWRILGWLEEASKSSSSHGGYGKIIYNLQEKLLWACSIVRVDGHYRKSSYNQEDEDSRPSTADTVAYCTRRAPPFGADAKYWREQRERYQPNDEDKERSQKVIEWVRSLKNPANDYLHNLTVMFAEDWFDPKKLGLVCSAVAAYGRHIEGIKKKEKKAEDDKKSQHFGEEKKRYDMELTVMNSFGFRGYMDTYGTCVIFVDDSGNQFKWFSSGELDVEKGERYKVKGTVKKHDDYKGVPQTVLSRCKIELIEEDQQCIAQS